MRKSNQYKIKIVSCTSLTVLSSSQVVTWSETYGPALVRTVDKVLIKYYYEDKKPQLF